MNINTILTLASLVIFLVVLAILYMRSKRQTVNIEVESFNTMDKVLEAVKNEMVEIVREDFTLGLSDTEFEKLYKRKARVNEALKNCVFGIDSAKVLVIDLIRGFIADKVPHEQITALLGLTPESEPSSQTKFEILMYRYKKAYGKDAFVKWVDDYNLRRERPATDAGHSQDMAYYITVDDLNYTYANEKIELDIEEQIDVLAILIYQQYKGFGIVDTLREMNIDGFNMGTSGSILQLNNANLNPFKANTSVWVYDRGRYIHLRFLNFGSEEEARRIIQLICRWGNPGPLTSKRGYLVNTMYDKSRVLAVRPPVSEYWAVFIRKFTLKDQSPEGLIIKEYTKRGDLAIRLIEFLMRGCITCAVTGRQGSGKTTLMSAIIRYIDPRYTIRVLELAPELYLRELYPTRNILSLQETSTVDAAEAQDALKKSDAAVSIVGEVATDSVAARMIQMGMTASIFTIFSHHGNTPKDLVLTLRNSLVNDGGFSNMETAEKQVTDVVKVDIHLDYTPDGKRYIHRISEIIPIEEGIPYPEYDPEDPDNSMNQITKEYYQRSTDRVGFYSKTILEYDLDTHTYFTTNRFTEVLEARLKGNLGDDLRKEYDAFMLKEWGPREGSPESELSEQELKEVIDKLEEDVVESSIRRKEMLEEITNCSEEVPQLECENKIKEMWAAGYTPSDEDKSEPVIDKIGDFEIGTFFDDDDYS